MAGLLAWAADVVGGSGHEDDDEDAPLVAVFTPEQQRYALELDGRAASLRRSIRELRLRIPPPHIAQRLPHLHAHSVASNAALALQLNAHSTTREQAQLREATLEEENAAYERAIANCQRKTQEKLQEAAMFQNKLKDIDLIENQLNDELEKELAARGFNQFEVSSDGSSLSGTYVLKREQSGSAKLEELKDKKRELSSLEETVQNLEKEWSLIQQDSIKQPSPAQREKLLEKQLHSLIEQLMGKQSQAEGLIREIHVKEKELEQLNGLWKRNDSGGTDVNSARNRFGKGIGGSGTYTTDYGVENFRRPLHTGGRTDNQLKLLRSAFVLYILALHVIVFIKLSF